MNTMKILLVNNGSHVGIASVGEAYKKAFEHLGLNFSYLDLFRHPPIHATEANLLVKAQLSGTVYDAVIMIQPSYLYASTYSYLLSMQKHTRFYSIHTEDPYSIEGMLMMSGLFTKLFTNEKKVAEKFEANRFVYLPLAYDSFKQYKRHTKKEYDFASICTYYNNRSKILEGLNKYSGNKFFGGNISWLAMNNMYIDMSIFTTSPGLMPRHKELEIYSLSKFVLNMHRPIDIVGKSNFYVPNKGCRQILEKAVSPNPRFFEAISCGSFPLNDICRTECSKIISKYYPAIKDTICIDKAVSDNNFYNSIISLYDNKIKSIESVSSDFLANESYLARAIKLLEIIEG